MKGKTESVDRHSNGFNGYNGGCGFNGNCESLMCWVICRMGTNRTPLNLTGMRDKMKEFSNGEQLMVHNACNGHGSNVFCLFSMENVQDLSRAFVALVVWVNFDRG